MKILVTGGKGLLGRNIEAQIGKEHSLIFTDIEEWDITDEGQGEEFIRIHRPDAVINLAAYTDVDGCEVEVEKAWRINCEGPSKLARLCERYGVKLLHTSTDYVFDGTKDTPYKEEDEPNPLSVYGRTKLQGEVEVLKINPSALIVRLEWLYGEGGENFITKVVRLAKERGRIEVVDDQKGSPTYAPDVVLPIKKLLEKGLSGIYHVANSGSCTWFQFAKEVFSLLKIDAEVNPITSDRLNRKAKRPSNSVYDCTKLKRDTGISLRSWQDALRAYLINTP
ncbi:MAG: dTDP-4-dehydrorhamnose reductase [Syntrophorhabdaceae bacterium]|nr:dTDP-4-dehydrorhamnose reductase [Syntrophorhabdaceae bacterium]